MLGASTAQVRSLGKAASSAAQTWDWTGRSWRLSRFRYLGVPVCRNLDNHQILWKGGHASVA